jgi:hypothetical protein
MQEPHAYCWNLYCLWMAAHRVRLQVAAQVGVLPQEPDAANAADADALGQVGQSAASIMGQACVSGVMLWPVLCPSS